MSGPASECIPQAALMSFAPINRIHQHLHGLHCFATDRTRLVSAHHFCSCAPNSGVRQCIIYDSAAPDARLIGIEYIVTEEVFVALPEEEKKYWHSHKYEVESGLLKLVSKALVPTAAEDLAEQSAMKELHGTYGKTIHTWQNDISPDLPLGPPRLMMAFTEDGQVDPATMAALDKVQGVTTEHKRELRKGYLDLEYEVKKGADSWKGGKAVELVPREEEVKMGVAKWKGKGEIA